MIARMKKPIHPAVVGVIIALSLVVVLLIFLRVSDSYTAPALKPPPAYMEEYKKKGLSMFPTTIPGKYSNSGPMFGGPQTNRSAGNPTTIPGKYSNSSPMVVGPQTNRSAGH